MNIIITVYSIFFIIHVPQIYTNCLDIVCCLRNNILIYMYINRELAWHDLAFYNADLYEGLRRMMLDAEEGKKDQEEFVATYCCYFEVS